MEVRTVSSHSELPTTRIVQFFSNCFAIILERALLTFSGLQFFSIIESQQIDGVIIGIKNFEALLETIEKPGDKILIPYLDTNHGDDTDVNLPERRIQEPLHFFIFSDNLFLFFRWLRLPPPPSI